MNAEKQDEGCAEFSWLGFCSATTVAAVTERPKVKLGWFTYVDE